MTEGQGQEIARRPSVRVSLNEPIADLDAAWRMATVLSQSTMVPDALRGKPGNALVVLMTGQELGLTPTQAMRMIYVAKSGAPGLRGELLLVKLRQAGHDYTFDLDDKQCAFTLHRSHEAPSPDPKTGKVAVCLGRDYTVTFTVDDAVQAGLCKLTDDGKVISRSSSGNPLPWEQYASDMLFWRACARAVRRGCPEVTFGFSIAGNDSTDMDETVTATAEVVPDPDRKPAHSAAAESTQDHVRDQLADIAASAQTTAVGNEPSDVVEAEIVEDPPADPVVEESPAEVPVSEPAAPDTEPGTTTPDPAPVPPADTMPASRAELVALSQALDGIGRPKDQRAHRLEACSVILRRHVTKPTDLTGREVFQIGTALNEMVSEAAKRGMEPSALADEHLARMKHLWETDEPGEFPSE